MNHLIVLLRAILKKHKKLKKWQRIVTVLAAMITFVTTYALILPAITVEKDNTDVVAGMYLEQEEAQDDMLEENALEPIGFSIAADQENAVTFAYSDDDMSATAIFSTDEEIPEGAELVVNPVVPESEEYADLSSRSAELLDKEYIYDVTTCSFYDFALVCDNIDVTPETGLVDIQIIFRNNTVEHIDDVLFAGRYVRPAAEADGFVEMSADNTPEDSGDITDAEDELVTVNPDESSVIELTDGIITVLTLKGNDLTSSDSLVGILAGYVDEEVKAAAAETDAETPELSDLQEEDALADPAKTDEEENAPAMKYLKAAGSDYTVTLTCDATSGIPKGADLTVSEIAQDSEEYQTYLEETKKAMGLTEEETLPRCAARFFDIKIMVGGVEFIPKSGVSVEITYAEPLAEKTDAEVSAVHFTDENAEAEVIEACASEVQDGGVATVGFTAESFSVYGVIYTVDFHWEVSGKTYDFSIPGGGFVTLRQLAEVLDIVNSEVTKDFVADVVSVEFSTPELVWVGKAEENTTAGEIKEDNELECQYSAGLSDSQIDEINNNIVEAGDWVLIGMQPFESEETLTVTMSNMDQFVVKVTDAQIKKDFLTASGETLEITVTYDESAEIPDDATLEITEFAEGSDEFQAAREAVIDKKESERSGFDESEIGIAAFDLSILDKDGKQVEPKATVDVSMIIKSLPEEVVESEDQNSIEIYHLDESSGDVIVETMASALSGSIQIEEESAQAEFQLDSFSTFTISWNRRGTNNDTTTFGWQDRYNTARGYITAQYMDESGNKISRPDGMGYTIYHGNFENGVTNTFNINSELAQSINNYTFTGAYVTIGETKQKVDSVTATRSGDVTTVTYYFEGQEVLSASYDATNVSNKRHDFTNDGLGLTLVYQKNNNYTTVHYGYMVGDTFVEFDEQPTPTDTPTSFGWAHLIYDFEGTDDLGLQLNWKYKGTYYWTSETTNPEGQGGVAMSPILRYNSNAWRYYTGTVDTYGPFRQNSNWHQVANDSDIYVVYEKPTVPMGGSPTLSDNGPQPDKPYILKESISNGDGTNTLSLSVTGSRAPREAERIADVIVILDLSSSMRRDIGSDYPYEGQWTGYGFERMYYDVENSRFSQAKKALQKLADELYELNGTDGQQYRMGLVTFSNKGTVRQYPTADEDVFQTVIDNITAYEGSGTNWEHALQLANEMSVPSDRATYIVFITDGEPSVRQTRSPVEPLSNEQLSGVNNTNRPADEGDIFHGGRSGGQFFQNNNDTNTPDFRDYLGSATFGGLMNNSVWDERNRTAAVDEITSIVGHNKGFYAIGVSSDVNYLGDVVNAGGVDNDHYRLVTNESVFEEVIDSIVDELTITGSAGQADVKVYDGITDLTQTISKVNQEEGRLLNADGNFVYYKSAAPEGWSTWTTAQKKAYEKGVQYAGSSNKPSDYNSYTQAQKDAFDLGQNITFTEWEDREEDGCAEAIYNTETGAVEWNMGQTFMLEEGVTYKVSFICWPSQEAYDIIAKLNNGTLTFGDEIYSEDIWNQFEGDITSGYTLKTNDQGANTTYRSATIVDGTVTVGDLQEPLPFQEVPPMPLEKDKINVQKTWETSRIDSQKPNEDGVVMQVWGANDMYKQFVVIPTETVNGSSDPNQGRSDDIYISCGHLKVNKNTGAVVIYESGHDFTLREVEENSRHWDLDASVCRPMVINTVPTMLVLVDNAQVPAGMTSSMEYYTPDSGNNEYYRIDGKVYKDTKAFADLTGTNSRRSFLDLAKEILVADQVSEAVVDPKFTYKIKINVDPTTLSWDPDIEEYVIISIRGDGYTPQEAIGDANYPTTAVLPSQSGLDPALIGPNDDNLYLVAQSGVEFYLSIKNGWSVRFLNLPVGTTYSIEEVLPANSDYLFNNVRLETRKDRTSQEPDTTNTYYLKTINGSISETSTLYKVVYQNEPKEGSLQITKSVQVDGQSTDTSYADGVYTFTLTDSKGNPAIGKVNGNRFDDGKVRITVTNGVASTITVTDLPIGEYTLTEDTPENEATLVGFAVNGQSKPVQNGAVVNNNDKKITIVANETATASFTNNVNTTQLEVHKVWSDGNPKGIDQIAYTIQRIRYELIDNEGEKEWVVWNTQRVNEDFTAEGFTGLLTANDWEEEVSKLPKRDYVLDEERHEYVYVKYAYYIKELTVVPGYKSMITGGEVDDVEHAGEYSFTITNEPLGPTDQNTHFDVKKLWRKADGTVDTDPHKDDTIYFTVTQKKYEANVTYTDNTGTHQAMLYPITVNLLDGDIPTDEGTQGTGVHPKSELSTVVYVPAGAEYTFIPHYEGGGYGTHHVYGAGFTSDDSGNHQPSDHRFTIDHVNSATEVTLTVYSGHDRWATENGYRKWTFTMESPQGIIWHLEELQEKVLQNISDSTHTEPVPKTILDYEYSMELTKDEDGLPTIIDNVGTPLGFGDGSGTVTWEGSITGLPLYEYKEVEDEQGGVRLVSYVYKYEVKEEVAINADTVNTVDPPEGWEGQSAIYFVKWEEDEDKTSDTYGLWTLTNQKKRPIDVTLYKVDKDNIPESSSLLEGAEFKLVKKKLVRTGEEGNYHWTWAKDPDWGDEGESAVIPESSQNPGIFSFKNLDAGYYEIVETKRPKGYIQADENPVFQVLYNHNSVEPDVVLVYASGENIGQPITGNATDLVAIDYRAIVVGNEHGAALPRTGGLGTTIFYLIGALLTGIAGASLIFRRRRRTV